MGLICGIVWLGCGAPVGALSHDLVMKNTMIYPMVYLRLHPEVKFRCKNFFSFSRS